MNGAASFSLSPTSLQTTFKKLIGAARKMSSVGADLCVRPHVVETIRRNYKQISTGVAYAHRLARPALRRANAVEATRLCLDCRDHSGAGYWRERYDVQSAGRVVAEAVARGGRPESARADRADI